MLNDVYGSTAPPKSSHFNMDNQPILTEDDIRQKMSDIARRADEERSALRAAYQNFAKREARVQLAITFMQPDLLGRKEARDYIEKAIADKVKLTVADKEALIMLELEDEKIKYDLAKFDCETSDKDYSKLEKQLSFYQSLLKMA